MRVMRLFACLFSLFSFTTAHAQEAVYYDQTVGEIRAHLAVGLLSLLDDERMLADGMETVVLRGAEALDILLEAGYGDENTINGEFEWIEALLNAEGAVAIYLPEVVWRDGSETAVFIPTPSSSTIDGLADRIACNGVMLRTAPGIAADAGSDWMRCDGQRGDPKCTRCICVNDSKKPIRCNPCKDSSLTPNDVLLLRVQQLCTDGGGFCRSFERFLSTEPLMTRIQSPL